MNKRIKKKKWKQTCRNYSTKKQRDANKALCHRYPFLIPRNVWTDKISWHGKPYSYTLVNAFPEGWWKAFGLQMCEELREDLIKNEYLHKFRFEQIKEKFGSLHAYTGPLPRESDAFEIIEDYSTFSENICIMCGCPDVHMINIRGWISPYCEECYSYLVKRNKWDASYSGLICAGDSGRMPDKRLYTLYQNGERQTYTRDISTKANKIRSRWRAK